MIDKAAEKYENSPRLQFYMQSLPLKNWDAEQLSEFFLSVLDNVANEQSETKRKAFAHLFANQVIDSKPWNQIESVRQLLDKITEDHICVLKFGLQQESVIPEDDKKRVFLLDTSDSDLNNMEYKSLIVKFSEFPPPYLRFLCSEMLSMGLLSDDGVGRYDRYTGQVFAITDTADWFISFLKGK